MKAYTIINKESLENLVGIDQEFYALANETGQVSVVYESEDFNDMNIMFTSTSLFHERLDDVSFVGAKIVVPNITLAEMEAINAMRHFQYFDLNRLLEEGVQMSNIGNNESELLEIYNQRKDDAREIRFRQEFNKVCGYPMPELGKGSDDSHH